MKFQHLALTLVGLPATLATAVPNDAATPKAHEEAVQAPISVNKSDIPEIFRKSSTSLPSPIHPIEPEQAPNQ